MNTTQTFATIGASVTGRYCMTKFVGTVKSVHHHTINFDMVEVTVSVPDLVINGTVRQTILLSVDRMTGIEIGSTWSPDSIRLA
jgi:hypothetical protein